MPIKELKTQSFQIPFHLNMLFSFFSLIFLFLLLTHAIPLAQLGWIPLQEKKHFIKLTRIAVLVYAMITFIFYKKMGPHFQKLSIIQGFDRLAASAQKETAIFFFSCMASLAILHGFIAHMSLQTRAFDLGIFAQAVWTTLHGNFLFSSIKENICLLGDHVSPILALLTPFYALWQDPRNLIILQALSISACVFPITYLANKELKNSHFTFVFLIMYVFYPGTWGPLREDFHPEALVDLFSLCVFIAIQKNKFFIATLLMLLVASAKENMLGITFALGFYGIFSKKKYLWGSIVMLFSVVIFLIEIKWIVPMFSHQKYLYASNYEISSLNFLFQDDRLSYPFKVFGPFLFLPFFNFSTLILTAPIFFQNFLSHNYYMRSYNFHYTSGLNPFLFIATIYGLKSFLAKFPKLNSKKNWIAIILLFLSFFLSAPFEYLHFWNILKNSSAERASIRKVLLEIPQEKSVLTQNNLIPQIANRFYVYPLNNSEPLSVQITKREFPDIVIFNSHLGSDIPSTIDTEITEKLNYNMEKDGNTYIFKKQNKLSYTQ